LITDNFVLSPKGAAFHQRCWRARHQRDLRESDPLCPICLQPIKLSDMVTGRQDDLMHAECDYTRR
jgi:hypothetical protein